MRNLFQPECAEEIGKRLAALTPDSQRLWGTMTPAQALAHCHRGLQTATGELKPPRVFIGRILGRIVKRIVLRDEKPLSKNSPTAPIFVIHDHPDFAAERERLARAVAQFATAGPAGCTTHPHTFFGKLTPEEWATLMYKHLDHHLRQFGA